MTISTTTYPYDTVVRITFTVGGVPYQGSGVLISPDEVLTASHVLYTTGIGQSQNVVVTPGYSSGQSPFGSSAAANVHYFPVQDGGDSISLSASQSDYAVIHLATAFPALGTMGLSANFTSGQVHVTGYPGSAGGALVDSVQTVVKDPRYNLLDGIAIGAGSSGGPVWVGGASNPQVVGLVSSELYGAGNFVQLTTADVNQIDAWVAADDGQVTAGSAYRVSAAMLSLNFGAYEAAALAGTLVSITLTNGATPAVAITVGQLLSDKDVLPLVSGEFTLVATATTLRGYSAPVATLDLGAKSGVTDIRFADGDVSYDPNSPAARITRLYQAALNRAPDQVGLYDWSGQLDGGVSLDTIAGSFVGSAEFSARFGADLDNGGFVTQLYANVLHRGADSGGLAAWTGQLAAGVSRADVLVDFSESAENRNDTAATVQAGIWQVDPNGPAVARLYDTVFARLPDVGGLANWEAQLAGGMSLSQAAASFTASPEFLAKYGTLSPTAFVTALYANTLHRAPDAAGLAGWTGQLAAGASQSSVVLGFSESAEHQDDTMANILSNDPSSYGIKTA